MTTNPAHTGPAECPPPPRPHIGLTQFLRKFTASPCAFHLGFGLVRRDRIGPTQHAVPAGPGPAGGDAGQPGPAAAAAAEARRGCVASPGPPRHGARPAHRAHRQPEPGSPALGPGALHRHAGRGSDRRPFSPATGKAAGLGGDIRPPGGLCPRRRGVIPRRKAKISVHSWTLTGTSRRVIRTQTGRARRLQGLLLGRVQSLGFDIREQATLETLTSDTASESRCFPP